MQPFERKGVKTGRLFGPEKLQNHTNKGKGKKKKKEREGRKEEKRKKAMVALLVFIMASFGGNVSKDPLTYI